MWLLVGCMAKKLITLLHTLSQNCIKKKLMLCAVCCVFTGGVLSLHTHCMRCMAKKLMWHAVCCVRAVHCSIDAVCCVHCPQLRGEKVDAYARNAYTAQSIINFFAMQFWNNVRTQHQLFRHAIMEQCMQPHQLFFFAMQPTSVHVVYAAK